MADVKRFGVKGEGFSSGFLENMQLSSGGLVLRESQSGGYISKVLDSTEVGTVWGRLTLKGCFDEECQYSIYSFATEDDTVIYNNARTGFDELLHSHDSAFAEKINILEVAGAQVDAGLDDILLTGQKGRYFVFAIRLFSVHEVVIESVNVMFPKEMLIQYLPEVFASEDSGFLERYLAIFGSIFADRRDLLAKLPDYLDIDKAPDDILPVLASWLGIELNFSFWSPDRFRKILKMAKEMSKFKGTKQVLEDIIEVYFGERPIIVEQFKWKKYKSVERQKGCENLYGSSANEFTLLIKHAVNETVFLHLKSLLDVLVPVRAKVNIVFLDNGSFLDRYTYVDINSKLTDDQMGITCDGEYSLDEDVYLV
jgi:phage tail-like protein